MREPFCCRYTKNYEFAPKNGETLQQFYQLWLSDWSLLYNVNIFHLLCTFSPISQYFITYFCFLHYDIIPQYCILAMQRDLPKDYLKLHHF